MKLYLKVGKNRSVGDLQEDFNNAFPFLKIDFYKKSTGKTDSNKRDHISKSVLLEKVGIIRDGTLIIDDTMTVGELEQSFNDQFGSNVQVSRKSGSLWLETTMTDKWTLRQQNEHGRELSSPEPKIADDNEIDYA